MVSRNKNDAKTRQLLAEWEASLLRYQTPLERGAIARHVSVNITQALVPPMTAGTRDNSNLYQYGSKVTTGGTAGKKENPRYTGSKVLGISTLHKSNLVPVFSKEEAIDVAKMRRG